MLSFLIGLQKNGLVVQTVPPQAYKKFAIFEKVKTVFKITFI